MNQQQSIIRHFVVLLILFIPTQIQPVSFPSEIGRVSPVFVTFDAKFKQRQFVRAIRLYFMRHMQDLTPEKANRLSRLVFHLGQRYRLAPGLILSIIRVESNFMPWAVSPRGALGLMQIMPETGQWLATRLGLYWSGETMLFDEEMNLTLGIHYLSYLWDKYRGDLRMVLSAYNRGPARVDRDLAVGRQESAEEYYQKVRQFLPSAFPDNSYW